QPDSLALVCFEVFHYHQSLDLWRPGRILQVALGRRREFRCAHSAVCRDFAWIALVDWLAPSHLGFAGYATHARVSYCSYPRLPAAHEHQLWLFRRSEEHTSELQSLAYL